MIETRAYRIELEQQAGFATLRAPDGSLLVRLSLLSAFDRADGLDETLGLEVRAAGDTVEIERRSTIWKSAGATITCGDERIELRSWVVGRGDLTDVHLLGGRSLGPGPTGFFPSGHDARTLFSPNPGDPAALVRSAGERAVIGVSGDGAPGRGHWFFTPAPLFFALGSLGIGLAAPVEELRFVEAGYEPADGAFHLALAYDGHTRVDGEFAAPVVVLEPGVDDAFAGLRRHREDLEARGFVPQRRASGAAWWREPIFCGWGAQCHLAARDGQGAPAYATQASYDAFLGALEERDVVPGTVVIDDKWQESYGTNTPDVGKWPNLAGWIAQRHARGQRVLLWWKAWDPEGLEPELCICTPDGIPVALDPTNPRTRELLRESMRRLVSTDGLDADGLKVDFTARTPAGRALRLHGENWGIALLHELLEIVYLAVKEAKPDALVITQTPHPSFVDVSDMIRLNDMLRLDDPGPLPAVVPQMRQRAAVAAAACPELLIDTDDWCVPDLATWREYAEIKPELGVPSLYYATNLDLTGEPLEAEDYAALQRTWADWRSR